jgi:TPR repeat protein
MTYHWGNDGIAQDKKKAAYYYDKACQGKVGKACKFLEDLR